MSQITNKISITRPTESLQLSSLIFAPIFVPRKRGYDANEPTEVSIVRTKNETIRYKGGPLDIAEDFPLFSVIMSQLQQHKRCELTISENLLLSALKKKSRESVKDSLEARLDKLQESKIVIERFNNGKKYDYIKASLIHRFRWDRNEKQIHFVFDDCLLPQNKQNTDFELIDLRFFNYFKTDYEKAAFLFLETQKYKKQKTVDIPIKKLLTRIAGNVAKTSEKNRKLSNTLASLKEAEYLKDYEFFKTFITHEKMVRIERNKDFERSQRFYESMLFR